MSEEIEIAGIRVLKADWEATPASIQMLERAVVGAGRDSQSELQTAGGCWIREMLDWGAIAAIWPNIDKQMGTGLRPLPILRLLGWGAIAPT